MEEKRIIEAIVALIDMCDDDKKEEAIEAARELINCAQNLGLEDEFDTTISERDDDQNDA